MNFLQDINYSIASTSVERISRWDVCMALLVSFILSSSVFAYITPENDNPVMIYKTMATEPYSFNAFPYGARILTPVLASHLPMDTGVSFRTISFFSFFICGTLLVLALRLFDVPLYWALALLPAFYLASSSRFIIANFWYIDPMSYWLLILLFIGMITGNFGVTMCSLALGALNRPESLSIIPVLMILWFNKEKCFNSLRTISLCVLPAILFVLIIRFIWPLISDYQVWAKIAGRSLDINSQEYSLIFQKQGFKALFDIRIYRETLPCLWGLAAIGLIRIPRRISLAFIVHIIIVILPMIIATDYFRLPFYVFPAIIIAAGVGLTVFIEKNRISAGIIIAAIWLLTAFAPQSIIGGLILAALVIASYWRFLKNEVNPQHLVRN